VNCTIAHSELITKLLCEHKSQDKQAALSVYEVTHQKYHDELGELIHPHSGWHLNASKTRAEQIESWDLADMATHMQGTAPAL
jgi:hypothetical protein